MNQNKALADKYKKALVLSRAPVVYDRSVEGVDTRMGRVRYGLQVRNAKPEDFK